MSFGYQTCFKNIGKKININKYPHIFFYLSLKCLSGFNLTCHFLTQKLCIKLTNILTQINILHFVIKWSIACNK